MTSIETETVNFAYQVATCLGQDEPAGFENRARRLYAEQHCPKVKAALYRAIQWTWPHGWGWNHVNANVDLRKEAIGAWGNVIEVCKTDRGVIDVDPELLAFHRQLNDAYEFITGDATGIPVKFDEPHTLVIRSIEPELALHNYGVHGCSLTRETAQGEPWEVIIPNKIDGKPTSARRVVAQAVREIVDAHAREYEAGVDAEPQREPECIVG